MEHFENTVSTQRIHEGRIINLREDTVALPSGRIAKREIVEHNGAICVVPILADGRIVMVRQFRKPAEDALLEIPAGGLNPNEDPEDCARRELIEECGLHGGQLTPLFTCYLAPGYSTELMYGFLGEDFAEGEAEPEEDENLEIEMYELEEVLPMIDVVRIRDAKTICGLLALYKRRVTGADYQAKRSTPATASGTATAQSAGGTASDSGHGG
jgi:ADP-ribose pyrophosphatase